MADSTSMDTHWTPTYFGIDLEPIFHASHVEIIDKASDPLHLYVAVLGAGDRALGYIHFYYESYQVIGKDDDKKVECKGKAEGTTMTSYVMIYSCDDVNWPDLPYHDEPEDQEVQKPVVDINGDPVLDEEGNPKMETIIETIMVPKQQEAYDEPKLQDFYLACQEVK